MLHFVELPELMEKVFIIQSGLPYDADLHPEAPITRPMPNSAP